MFKTHQSVQPHRAILASLFVIVVLILAACAPTAGANLSPTNTPSPVPPIPTTATVAPIATMALTATTAPMSGVTINTSTKDGIGTYLVDAKGMTLYIFTKDTPGVSACTSAGCLKAWPILEATGDPVAGTGRGHRDDAREDGIQGRVSVNQRSCHQGGH